MADKNSPGWDTTSYFFKQVNAECIVQFMQEGVDRISCAVSELEGLEDDEVTKAGEALRDNLHEVLQEAQERIEALLYEKQFDEDGELFPESLCYLKSERLTMVEKPFTLRDDEDLKEVS